MEALAFIIVLLMRGSARKSASPLWKISRSRSLRIQHLTCERQEPKG
jgi:hypothetical protein